MIDKLAPENQPATINWRSNRLALWEKLRSKRDADYSLARSHTTEMAALEYVGDLYRAEVRTFAALAMRRASRAGVLDYLEHAPSGWPTRTELLLEAGDVVPRLVRRAYPEPSWAKAVPDLAKNKAANDRDWFVWLDLFGEQLGRDVTGGAAGASNGAKLKDAIVKWAPLSVASFGVVAALLIVSRR